jgi:formylglycine-generating enzyme required for sulfatase activity
MYNPSVRSLAAILLLALSALSAHAAEPPAYPLWDGSESIEQYSKRAKLEPTTTLDLGNGVKLEMVLIPAGKFTMGTPEPTPVDEEGFRKKIIVGQVALAVGGGTLLVLLGLVAIRAIWKRRRPQFSLAYLLAMTVVAGVGLLGGLHWYFSAGGRAKAQAEYQAAEARFNASYDDEKPAHEVTLTKPFYLGEFEVTQEQYEQITGTDPSYCFTRGRDLPAEMPSWMEAQEFCKKASRNTGLVVRLPTEAEWEHACRAGSQTSYCSGDDESNLGQAAWYGGNSGITIHPVGQKAPNAWGLYDMHGNVSEWCADFWCSGYGAGAATDPKGPAQGEYRVFRGGSHSDDPSRSRSASRNAFTPEFPGFMSGGAIPVTGFRVVVDVPSKTP